MACPHLYPQALVPHSFTPTRFPFQPRTRESCKASERRWLGTLGHPHSHFDERRPICSLSTVSLDHSTFFSGFRFRSLMVRLRFSCKVKEVWAHLAHLLQAFPISHGTSSFVFPGSVGNMHHAPGGARVLGVNTGHVFRLSVGIMDSCSLDNQQYTKKTILKLGKVPANLQRKTQFSLFHLSSTLRLVV